MTELLNSNGGDVVFLLCDFFVFEEQVGGHGLFFVGFHFYFSQIPTGRRAIELLKQRFLYRSTCPRPTPEFGDERSRRPQAQMRYIPPSSTGVRLVHPLRSCSGTDLGKRRKTGVSSATALPILQC